MAFILNKRKSGQPRYQVLRLTTEQTWTSNKIFISYGKSLSLTWRTPEETTGSGFSIPILDDLSNLYDDFVNGVGELTLSLFSNLQHNLKTYDLKTSPESKKIIRKLEDIRLLFDLVKHPYDDNTLNYKIYSNVEKQLTILIDQIREGRLKDAQSFADKFMDVFQTINKNKKMLRDEGTPLLTMVDTGERIGGMRIFKAMKD